MALILRENQYRGVNAHLHSYLQNTQEAWGWDMFCHAHSCDIAKTLGRLLPADYRAIPYPHEVLGLYEVIVKRKLEDNSRAIAVHISILSPRHKSQEDICALYTDRRTELLKQGKVVVELDYLHQADPVYKAIPSYLKDEKGANPYYITVVNPRPSFQAGTVSIYGFHVNDSIPYIEIPISDDDKVTLDMGGVYTQTFEAYAYFSDNANYEQAPVRFETYTPEDQAHIQAVMAEVQAKHKGS